MSDLTGPSYGSKPPWWRWYEPPRWFPDWLHLITCTYCRTMARYVRKRKGEIRVLR